MIEGKRVRINNAPDLIDPMVMTQSVHLDPTRDGVLARALRYGSAAAIGSAIGVGGGLVAKQFLFQNNNITQRLKDGSRSLAGQPVQMRFEAKRYPINSNITHYCGIILMSYHFQ